MKEIFILLFFVFLNNNIHSMQEHNREQARSTENAEKVSITHQKIYFKIRNPANKGGGDELMASFMADKKNESYIQPSLGGVQFVTFGGRITRSDEIRDYQTQN